MNRMRHLVADSLCVNADVLSEEVVGLTAFVAASLFGVEVLGEEIVRLTAFVAGSLFGIQIVTVAGSLFDGVRTPDPCRRSPTTRRLTRLSIPFSLIRLFTRLAINVDTSHGVDSPQWKHTSY